jgi:hypothetical protein
MIDKASRKTKKSSDTEDSLDQSEQKRLEKLYKFLLSLTDLGMADDTIARKRRDGISRPNETFITDQWGLGNNRLYVRRILMALYPTVYEISSSKEEKKSLSSLPGIDLHRLVTILVSLNKFKNGQHEKRSNRNDELVPLLTHAHRTTALRLFSELSVSERSGLGMETSVKDKLLMQLTEKLSDPSFSISEPLLREIYTLTLREDPVGNSDPRSPNPEASYQEKIESRVEKILKENFFAEDESILRTLINTCTIEVNQEIDRILMQSGEQFASIGNAEVQKKVNRLRKNKLYSDSFINTVVYSVVRNHILTREFPIFLCHIEVKRLRPLPLRVYDDKAQPDGLLDEKLVIAEGKHSRDAEIKEMQGLSGQKAYKVKVFFFIEVEERKGDQKIRKSKNFYDEAMGIGSPISLATAVVNRLLLSDLECLRDKKVFPVAKQILLNDKILSDSHSSPIWSHSIVQLCNTEVINESIEEFKKNKDANLSIADYYNSLDSFGEAASGDACGFDLLEVVIKSGLSARLCAIKKLGVKPEIYMKQLSEKLGEIESDRKATSYLRNYPLSFWAMQEEREEKILKHYREKRSDESKSKEYTFISTGKHWSHLAYNAHMKIAEYSLLEGKTSRAREYLDLVDTHEHREKMNALLRARLSYTKAYYFYLYNFESNPNTLRYPYNAIDESLSLLREAKQFLQQRAEECYAIDELAFANSHTFFTILGRINYLEACINLFFGNEVRKEDAQDRDKAKDLIKALSCIQKARICAAKAGNYNDYACFSSIQSWCFLMLDYLPKDKYNFGRISNILSSDDRGMSWSHQLIKHAMICYGEIGKECYLTLKENSGKNVKMEEHTSDSEEEQRKYKVGYQLYGSIKIQDIGFIQEVEDGSIDVVSDNSVIKLKISLLRKDVQMRKNSEKESVFLFGPFSSIILFGLGINKLLGKDFTLTDEESSSEAPVSLIKMVDKQIIEIDDSIKLLMMSLSIAQDGNKQQENQKNSEDKKNKIERNFDSAVFDPFEVSSIRGFYPCRISQIIPLSTISMIAGTLLRLIYIKPLYSKEEDWETLMQYIDGEKEGEIPVQNLPDKLKTSNPEERNTLIKSISKPLKLKEMFKKYQSNKGENFDGMEKEINAEGNKWTRNVDFNSHLKEHIMRAMEYLKWYHQEICSWDESSPRSTINDIEDLNKEFSKNKEKMFGELFNIILGGFH